MTLNELGIKPFEKIYAPLGSSISGLEVARRIPTKETLEIAAAVVDIMELDGTRVFNNIKFDVIFTIEWLKRATNLEFTEEELEDYGRLYDSLKDCGLLDAIDFYYYNDIRELVKAVYDYNNSAYGIMEGIVAKYQNAELDIEKLTNELKDPDAIPLLKEIMEKLG